MSLGIERLISESALDMHKEHVRDLKLKLSILEKSYPELAASECRDIMRSRSKYKREAVFLKCEIKMHELYFSSFGEGYQRSFKIKEQFGSESEFLYEVLCGARDKRCDYILVSLTKREAVALNFGGSELLLTDGVPLFCVDLCEHAYFLDFGFQREEYLKRVLPYLNLRAIDKFCGAKD